MSVPCSYRCLVLLQPRKTRPSITEFIIDWDVKNQIKQTNCSLQPFGYLLGMIWPLGSLACNVFCLFGTVSYFVLGQVWYLIVSVPDLSLLKKGNSLLVIINAHFKDEQVLRSLSHVYCSRSTKTGTESVFSYQQKLSYLFFIRCQSSQYDIALHRNSNLVRGLLFLYPCFFSVWSNFYVTF